MKFETRDLIALAALGLVGEVAWLNAHGHEIQDWLKMPVGGVLTVLLGYYFVDSVRKPQIGNQPPAPKAADAPDAGPQPDAGLKV